MSSGDYAHRADRLKVPSGRWRISAVSLRIAANAVLDDLEKYLVDK